MTLEEIQQLQNAVTAYHRSLGKMFLFYFWSKDIPQ